MPPILLIDQSNLAMRAFYGTFRPGRPLLASSRGFPTNCISTWSGMVEGLVRHMAPQRLIFVIDGKPQRRLQLHPAYKVGRPDKPVALQQQLPVLHQLIRDSGLEYCYEEAEEADDLIAALAHQFEGVAPVSIVSADKDFSQCVTERVTRLVPGPGGGWGRLGEAEIVAEYGVRPNQFAQYLALVGDDADNIPGIDLIGPGKAAKILAGEPSIDLIIERVATLKRWTRDEAAASFQRSYTLTRAIDVGEVTVRRGANLPAALAKLDELECRKAARVLQALRDWRGPLGPVVAAQREAVAPGEQQELF